MNDNASGAGGTKRNGKGMTRILVLADTHIPRSAHDLPHEIYDVLDDIDMIFHAGDFVEKEIYEKLAKLKPLKAVYGNMDSRQVTENLNQKEIVQVGRFRIGLIHGYGVPRDIIDTVRGEFRDVHAIVFGHSHEAINMTKEGILFFNPGSPTDKVFAAYNSYGILEVTDTKIEGKIVKL
ncbi:MAG: metallophosphoesterase family protein [Candidatus Omnitrophota bacterium]